MFYPGQEVICIRDVRIPPVGFNWLSYNLGGVSLPKEGKKYTIRSVEKHHEHSDGKVTIAVSLHEVRMPLHPLHNREYGFDPAFFRPIVKTDISVFQKLCNPVRTKELEVA